MATTTSSQPAAPHTLPNIVSQSTTSHAAPTTEASSTLLEIPRGDVLADLNFYVPPSDSAIPFMYVEAPPAGEPKDNYSRETKQVLVHDIRGEESKYTLDKDAFAILKDLPPSSETEFRDDKSIEEKYYPEVERLLLERIPGANRVIIFDHTIRRSNPNAHREPVFRTHIDQTASAARERVRRHSPSDAESLLQGRFRIINVWRPLNGPVLSNPLAFASSHSVRNEDIVPVEHRYPDRTGYTASILYNEQQRWNYLSGMTNQERILLECYDSEGEKPNSGVEGGRVPHTAFKNPRTPVGAPGRESIEVRTLVFGP